MLSKKRQLLMAIFLLLMVTTVIPMGYNLFKPATTKINTDHELNELGHRSTYVTVPITVNKVQGTSLTKAQVEANIKKMNDIYNSEVVIFVWDGVIHEIPDPSKPGGNADGGTPSLDDRTKVRNDAEKNAGGKGVSVTVSSDLGPNTNGMAIVGESHSVIVKSGTDGSTWAHEVQHAMGQSHGTETQADEDMDGDGDVDSQDTGWDANGDGKINKEDRKYNLWGRKSDREDDKINCNVIYGNASVIEGAVNKTRPAPSTVTPGTTKQGGGINDTRGDPKNETSGATVPDAKHVDLVRGGMLVNWLWPWFKFWLELVSGPLINCTYTIAIDNAPGLGASYKYIEGADIIVEFSMMQGLDGLTFISQWNDTMHWFEDILPPIPFEIQNLSEAIDYDNSTGSGWVESFFDVMFSVEFISPEFAMALGEAPFEMWAVSQAFDSQPEAQIVDNSSKRITDLTNLPVQAITVDSDNVTAGQSIQVSGIAFTADSNVVIFIDGTVITTVNTDQFGEFAVNITVPSSMSTINNSIIMARDFTGNGDAIYIDITGLPSNGGIIGFEYLGVTIGLIGVVIVFLKKKEHNL
ncbi:MAG: hypothetical protein ACTSQI_07900 [Candidatus Helarchaeota archaeon]